jgi:hypothetical protein
MKRADDRDTKEQFIVLTKARNSNRQVAGELESLADVVVRAAKKGEDPQIDIPVLQA